jgi:hypothetical protein
MKYHSGREVAVGDRVKLWHDKRGTVVCSIDSGKYSPNFPREEWEYLASGIVIETDSGEVFHYSDPDEDFEFVKSATTP